MRIGFVTLFPDFVRAAMSYSIVGRAVEAGLIDVSYSNPRDFASDPHRTVDDSPYGGGPGMVLKPSVVAEAIRALHAGAGTPVVLMDPAAPLFTNHDAKALSQEPAVILVCGHYEGVDERVRTSLCTHAFSIGDFVLTGGELPSLCIADAISRLIPGVLGDPESHRDDSYESGLLGFPTYTRPPSWEGHQVPDILMSGDHGAIAKWRRQQQLERTRRIRPDLFAAADLTNDDLNLL